MPFYAGLRRFDADDRRRAADRLLRLRQQLRSQIPGRTVTETLLLATWNIRDFDSNRWRHGPRLPESFYYIAEIIAAFDLVAIQEVNDDLDALERVMRLLGPGWDYIVTDVTEGSGGNGERMAFVYDRSKVLFRKVAGEIVLPGSHALAEGRQFARTPFLVAFQCGWFKFNLCTAHIYYGEGSAGMARRIEEIDALAKFLNRRAETDGESFILLGDFNIVGREHGTMRALTSNGFHVPAGVEGSNLSGDKYYDQIAFRIRRKELEPGTSGVFRYGDSVYGEADFATYRAAMPAEKLPADDDGQRRYYLKEWRTWQISDHCPMWVELRINFSEEYLAALSRP